jgi:hypothetical protein
MENAMTEGERIAKQVKIATGAELHGLASRIDTALGIRCELVKHEILAKLRFIAANQDGKFAEDLENVADSLESTEITNPQLRYKDVHEAWDKVRQLEANRGELVRALGDSTALHGWFVAKHPESATYDDIEAIKNAEKALANARKSGGGDGLAG